MEIIIIIIIRARLSGALSHLLTTLELSPWTQLLTLRLVRVGWPPHARYLPSLAHQVIVLKMHPRGALLFEGPLALRMPRDKKEAVRSEGNVKGVVTLNSSVEEQLSVEFVIKDYMDILSTNQCGSEIARWAPQSWGTDKKSARRESV